MPSLHTCKRGHDYQPHVGIGTLKQKSCDQLRVLAATNQDVESAVNDNDTAHMLALSTKESETCLHVFPTSALWLLLK